MQLGHKGTSLVELVIASAIMSILVSAIATSGSMMGRMNSDINAMVSKSETYMTFFQMFNSQKVCGKALQGERVRLSKTARARPLQIREPNGVPFLKTGSSLGSSLVVKKLSIKRYDDLQEVFGDYNRDDIGSIGELHACVDRALGVANATYTNTRTLDRVCDTDGSGDVRVNDLVRMAGARIEYDIINNPNLPGDCNQDGYVTLNELMTGRTMAMEGATGGDCFAQFDTDNSGRIEVADLVRAVNQIDRAADDIFNIPAEIQLITQNRISKIESPKKFLVYLRVKPNGRGMGDILGCGVDNNL